MTPTVNTYYSGAGLMDLGLQLAGLTIQQSFELDGDCCATLRANFGHDIVQSDLREKLVADEKPCEVMVGTYPCKRYSRFAEISETRTGDELFLHFFRHIAIGRPEVYSVENVPGMKAFPVVMEAMTRLPDYYVNVFCPVQTHLWLPQKRDRLIIIGSKRNFLWSPPQSRRRISLREILEDSPAIEVPDYVFSRLDGAYRDRPIISDPSRDDIAPICLAHYSRDLSTRLVVDRNFKRGVRPYTVREYARLQGVPDWFQFIGGDSKAYQMIGNGVSVPVGQWLGNEIMRYFR